MNELLQLALSQRRIKEILNVVFVGSVASFLFEAIFFKYSLIELSDFNVIYWFFIGGHFIVPLALFYCVWILTIFMRMLLFQVPNFFITQKIGEWLRESLISYYNGDTILNVKAKMPKSKSLQHMLNAFSDQELDQKKLLKRTIQSHKRLESDFTLIFRGLVAVTIYFINLEYFGWVTYLACILILISMWVLQTVNYQLAEIAPEIIRAKKEQIVVKD